MFSQTVEYALRAVAFLAGEAPAARTTDPIAAATRVPKPYLSKVLQQLVREGVVQSQRGVGGGMSLVKAPAELTILEVVNAVEPIARIRQCPFGLRSASGGWSAVNSGRGCVGPSDGSCRGEFRTDTHLPVPPKKKPPTSVTLTRS